MSTDKIVHEHLRTGSVAVFGCHIERADHGGKETCQMTSKCCMTGTEKINMIR